MKFKPHDRVIELLVGQNFYTTSDHAIRELLQNAEDACELQRTSVASFQPEIVVRFSRTGNWVEVTDNGLGMNLEAFENSFAAVAAPKDEVSHLRELLERSGSKQIAYFGIGILSCFGVADSILVSTKMDEFDPLAYRIPGYTEEFEEIDDKPTTRGTVVRLQLKPDGPMQAEQAPASVRRYARHAPHVFIDDVDSSTREPITEQWFGSDRPGATRVNDTAARGGVLALDGSWDDSSAPQSRLTVCNGGFLVTDQEQQLLPQNAIGYVGEIDVAPGELSILINREGFQRDDRWVQLGQRLSELYNQLIEEKIKQWSAQLNAGEKLSDGATRGILLLLHGPTKSVLQQPLVDALSTLLPRMLRVKVAPANKTSSAAAILDRARSAGVLFYLREDQGPRKFQQNIGLASTQVQVTEVLQTVGLRTSHLVAKGHTVVHCVRRQFSVTFGGSTQKVVLHDADLLSGLCQQAGVRWVPVDEATPEEVRLEAARQSELVTQLLGADSEIKLTSVESDQRVIRDVTGRLLNCSHPEIREILRALPDAVGNPVKRALLQAYMDLDTWHIEAARRKIMQLFVATDLSDKAQLSTGKYLREFLQEQVDSLLSEDQSE